MKKFVVIICCISALNAVAVNSGRTLIFSDEFNDATLNTEIWNTEVNSRGGGNAEMQYYKAENVTVENAPTGEGCLVLTAKVENYGNRPATSGRVNTHGKFSFKYGTMEVRAMFPKTADGLWPAIWMLGDNLVSNMGNDDSIDKQKRKLKKQGYVIWPKCGEIDLLEMGNAVGIKNNTQERYYNGACHWGEDFNDGKYPNLVMNNTSDYSLQDGKFHLITLEWSKDSILMYLDKDVYPNVKPYFSLYIGGCKKKNAPSRYFNHPFYLVMNLAVGGYFTGLPAPEKYPEVISPDFENFKKIANSALKSGEAKLYIDYIRIYK